MANSFVRTSAQFIWCLRTHKLWSLNLCHRHYCSGHSFVIVLRWKIRCGGSSSSSSSRRIDTAHFTLWNERKKGPVHREMVSNFTMIINFHRLTHLPVCKMRWWQKVFHGIRLVLAIIIEDLLVTTFLSMVCFQERKSEKGRERERKSTGDQRTPTKTDVWYKEKWFFSNFMRCAYHYGFNSLKLDGIACH